MTPGGLLDVSIQLLAHNLGVYISTYTTHSQLHQYIRWIHVHHKLLLGLRRWSFQCRARFLFFFNLNHERHWIRAESPQNGPKTDLSSSFCGFLERKKNLQNGHPQVTLFLYSSQHRFCSNVHRDYTPPVNRNAPLFSGRLVSMLVLWAQSTTKDYIRAEHKLHSISKLFTSRVMTPQVTFLSAGTQHGNLPPAGWPISFCGPAQEPALAATNTGKTRERFWKNAGGWTRRVEISKEEIPGSKRSMHGYILTYSRI